MIYEYTMDDTYDVYILLLASWLLPLLPIYCPSLHPAKEGKSFQRFQKEVLGLQPILDHLGVCWVNEIPLLDEHLTKDLSEDHLVTLKMQLRGNGH